MKTNKVFLGGTWNGSTWREELIEMIQIKYFNPVVEDWTPECKSVEDAEKEVTCNIHLYVITSDMIGAYSIAEAVQSSNEKSKSTILHILPDGFSKAQIKSFEAIKELIISNGSICYIDSDLSRTGRLINTAFKTTDFT